MSTLDITRTDSHAPPAGHGADDAPALTAREAVVLEQLAEGSTLAGIAAALFVSKNTIKTQVQSLYRKLGVTCREDAVAWARARGDAGS